MRLSRIENVCICQSLGIVLVLWAGCSRPSGPQRLPVQGTVMVNGQPLHAGRIRFTPQLDTKGPGTGAGVSEGLFAVPKEEGLFPGMYRVEIEGVENVGFALDDDQAYARRQGRPLPANPIPPQFNKNSSLAAEIKTGEENTFTFNLRFRSSLTR